MVEKAADKGHFDSILRVADCYSSGHGVEKDLTTAALYIYQGAEKGDVASQYNLGICYTYGIGFNNTLLILM